MSAPLSAAGVERIAQALTISSRETSKRERWRVWDEQRTLWRLMERHPRLLCAKARKVGISTACELWDVLWTWNMDDAGHRVRCVIAIDTDAKAQEHCAQIVDFCRQLKGIGVTLASHTAHSVTFPNGSKIECMTAGGEDPGRGGQIHRLHVTELPFWRQPRRNYQALRSSCSDNAQVIIETTMDLQNDAEWVTQLWDDAGCGRNELHRHFWSVEAHAIYRSPIPITDEEWRECRAEGFTDRKAAAFWLKDALPNKCAGSRLMLMHDFPQKEDHLFAAGLGRIITANPPQALVDGYLEVPGVRGDVWNVEVYGEPVYLQADSLAMLPAGFTIGTYDGLVYDDAGRPVVERTERIEDSGQVVIAIDTARGVKKTNSIVVAVDKRDRRILSCFWNNEILYDDLARVAQTLRDFYSVKRPQTMHTQWFDGVTVVVEADGIGDATRLELQNLGCPHEAFFQGNVDHDGNSNAARCIAAAKTHIESRTHPAPAILRTEVRELVRDEQRQIKGKKDCVMMYGMANLVIDDRPYQPPRHAIDEKERKQRVSFEESLREYELSAAGEGIRPKWGT